MSTAEGTASGPVGPGRGAGVFRVGERDFELDGRPLRLLSGALHYFRVHEEQWAHRLGMLRAMGLNCVETYVPWNLHEPEPGVYRDVAALGRFLDAVREAGLWAIVRPGPYICAEWENGGLPHWVTGPLGARVRTRDAGFLQEVERWFGRLLPQVVERQVDRGGPVLMVQVENEYGSYGSDAVYLERLTALLRARGVSVPLCTSDGPTELMLSAGTVPGVLATVNFGSGSGEAFETLRRIRPSGPLMCMEYWCGWFTHWGEERLGEREARSAAEELRAILEAGASVNVYMAHGGSNPAGWAGANRAGPWQDGELEATVTSYDYDAPVDEAGRATRKFWLMREVLAAYAAGPLPQLPAAPPVLAEPVRVAPRSWAAPGAVVDALGGGETEFGTPPSFEELGVDRGLVRYRLRVPGPRRPLPLRFPRARDLLVLYVDGVRTEQGAPVAGGAEVEVWTESLGRVNYGPRLGESKGLTGGVLHEAQYLHGVRATGLRLDAFEEPGAVARLPFEELPDGERAADSGAGDGAAAVPGADSGEGDGVRAARGLHRARFAVRGAGDAWLSVPGFGRGFVWVNGSCVGRYWSAGPQRELFVPGPLLREGEGNELWVLELEGPAGAAAGARGAAGAEVALRPVETRA